MVGQGESSSCHPRQDGVFAQPGKHQIGNKAQAEGALERNESPSNCTAGIGLSSSSAKLKMKRPSKPTICLLAQSSGSNAGPPEAPVQPLIEKDPNQINPNLLQLMHRCHQELQGRGRTVVHLLLEELERLLRTEGMTLEQFFADWLRRDKENCDLLSGGRMEDVNSTFCPEEGDCLSPPGSLDDMDITAPALAWLSETVMDDHDSQVCNASPSGQQVRTPGHGNDVSECLGIFPHEPWQGSAANNDLGVLLNCSPLGRGQGLDSHGWSCQNDLGEGQGLSTWIDSSVLNQESFDLDGRNGQGRVWESDETYHEKVLDGNVPYGQGKTTLPRDTYVEQHRDGVGSGEGWCTFPDRDCYNCCSGKGAFQTFLLHEQFAEDECLDFEEKTFASQSGVAEGKAYHWPSIPPFAQESPPSSLDESNNVADVAMGLKIHPTPECSRDNEQLCAKLSPSDNAIGDKEADAGEEKGGGSRGDPANRPSPREVLAKALGIPGCDFRQDPFKTKPMWRPTKKMLVEECQRRMSISGVVLSRSNRWQFPTAAWATNDLASWLSTNSTHSEKQANELRSLVADLAAAISNV